MKSIKYILLILIIALIGYAIYTKFNQTPVIPIDKYEQDIQTIMNEETFQKSVRLQAETIHATREKKNIEKKLEDLRKQELELASTTKQLSLE
jgi:predicted Holliday junction resolvase-like endonuclease